MYQRGKPPDGIMPDGIMRRPLVGTCAMKGSRREITAVDRIALAAMFSVTLLVLAMFRLSVESEMQPVPAAASAAMSSYVGLPFSEPDHRMTHQAGKH